MRWKELRRSENVEDRRSFSGRGIAVGGGLGTIVLAVIALLTGVDPSSLFQSAETSAAAPSADQDELVQFVSAVLGSTEDVWHELLGSRYREPTLVLFRGQVDSACGLAGAAVGPFYCPEDEKLYVDLSFYRELRDRFGAPGDFAQAYVIAHEIGHHVQKLLGTLSEAHARQARDAGGANEISVRIELQADFYAGVWAHYAREHSLLDPGDVEEALQAASAIGDDRLQLESQGYVVPESFTHGTAAQRLRWLRRGLETGDLEQGDTFSARSL